MKLLWLSWKDQKHPLAGGAELVMHELSKRLIENGHDVTILTSTFPGAKPRETIDGIKIIRIGANRYTHPFKALFYYLQNLRNRFDVVVEVVNTAPYLSVLFGGKSKNFLFYHQFAREIWFCETPTPLSHIGYYLLEPAATLLAAISGSPVITVSQSTKRDAQRFGFSPNRINIIGQGLHIKPIDRLDKIQKYAQPTMLSLGALRAMKRPHLHIEAFEEAKKSLPNLRLIMAGDPSGDYGQRVLRRVKDSPHSDDIQFLGPVSLEKKLELMQQAHVLVMTSIKEGWGLVVSEAASQGTPSVVYDVDGLRDSVRDGTSGVVAKTNPKALAAGVVEILKNKKAYQAMRQAGWQWSKQLTFDQAYQDFLQIITSQYELAYLKKEP